MKYKISTYIRSSMGGGVVIDGVLPMTRTGISKDINNGKDGCRIQLTLARKSDNIPYNRVQIDHCYSCKCKEISELKSVQILFKVEFGRQILSLQLKRSSQVSKTR